MIPAARTRPDDRVGGVPLPAGQPVSRTGHADLGMLLIAKANVEHQEPAVMPQNLTRGHAVLLPGERGIGAKDGIAGILGPGDPIPTGRMPDGVGLVLLSPEYHIR